MPKLSNIPTEPMRITVDTREQTPWVFPSYLVSSRRGTLKAGDYALDGDDQFAIERKSLDDFVGSITDKERWQRLRNELQRMTDAGFVARVIVVEGDYEDILTGAYNSGMPAHLIMARMYKLTMDGVSVVFAGDAIKAAGVAYGLLKMRQEQIERKTNEE